MMYSDKKKDRDDGVRGVTGVLKKIQIKVILNRERRLKKLKFMWRILWTAPKRRKKTTVRILTCKCREIPLIYESKANLIRRRGDKNKKSENQLKADSNF